MNTKTDNASSTPKPKQAEIYKQLAATGGALANPHRLKMLNLLCHGEKSVDTLARLTGQSMASASAHVKVLRTSHLVVTEKRGRQVFCSLSDSRVDELWLAFRDLGEAVIPEIREIMRNDFNADESLSPLSEHDLHERIEKERFTLLDLRPVAEYKHGHLPKSRNVPFAHLDETTSQLSRKSPLLVYCRGPFCAAAIEGNDLLRAAQFRSQRLRFSVPEWKAAGYPVEVN